MPECYVRRIAAMRKESNFVFRDLLLLLRDREYISHAYM
jgi:hypothetical protein